MPPEDAAQRQLADGKKTQEEKRREDAQPQPADVTLRHTLDGQQEHHEQSHGKEKMGDEGRGTPAATEAIEIHVFRKQHPGKNGADQVNDEA